MIAVASGTFFNCALPDLLLPTQHSHSRLDVVGSTDHFDWFMDYFVGLFTSSLVSYTEKLRSLNTSDMISSPLVGEVMVAVLLVFTSMASSAIGLVVFKPQGFQLQNFITDRPCTEEKSMANLRHVSPRGERGKIVPSSPLDNM